MVCINPIDGVMIPQPICLESDGRRFSAVLYCSGDVVEDVGITPDAEVPIATITAVFPKSSGLVGSVPIGNTSK